MAQSKETDGIDYKLPWWDGDWLTFSDYQLRVELRADATKKDELALLGPRLAGNLIGKAFDSLIEVNREELKKEMGWRYLLDFLEKRRGKEKVDLLGDTFTEFFLRPESQRKHGEELTDYEPRFRQLVRKLDKAVLDAGSQQKMPPELYGWFLLNVYMKMDASDTANVRGRADSYRLEDVFAALKKMWSGGGLASRDQERKRRKEGQGYIADETQGREETDTRAYTVDDGELCDLEDATVDLEEATVHYQDTLEAMLEEPEDPQILASFREARQALNQARNARGFFPVRNPNNKSVYAPGGAGNGSERRTGSSNSGATMSDADRICYRCGKKGHRAKFCPQRPQRNTPKTGDKIGFVGVVTMTDDGHTGDLTGQVASVQQTSDKQEMEDGHVLASMDDSAIGRAIIDSGASDNIVGVETLDEFAAQLEQLGFSAEDEIVIDRGHRKNFMYGNNESNRSLGRAHITVGIFGHELEIEAHVVEGSTPFLLSSRFLAEMNATLNFRMGVIVMKRLSEQHYTLERTAGNHLILPLTAFPGRPKLFVNHALHEPDSNVQKLSRAVHFQDTEAIDEGGKPNCCEQH